MSALGRRVVAGAIALALMVALGGCVQRSGEWADAEYRIAGGGPTGVYYAYGSGLASELSESLDVRMTAQETAGSVDNLLRVGSGESLLGFAQGDAAADAVAGVGAFDQPLRVEALARLYDEYVHVVVREDSDVETIADLAGKTVSLGAENSGVNVIAARVLDAAGVQASSVQDPQLDLAGSIRAMERAEIDGFFWVGGIPTPGIADLAATLPVRLLPIEQSWVNHVNEQYSDAYRPSDFPVGLYGLEESEPTMAVPNYLVTSSETPDGVVRDVLQGLFDARTRLGLEVPAAALLDRRQAIFTGPVALHPGAIEFYRELRD
ncbi:TAXI family TRAP transporter solute-binding subunit [Microbacterium sp. SD291]|uniref:TAXI family TRAP transporter solute-binding subunit n=1 Tax=Microbacterium sp. SD291 TaxID=2782007 RepID=UPI001A978CC7|nr:TAXI family TRAP transporter solute-binding subunit [Microbacterium sp. SD291]MBO0981386.1 TAXI family TRAP transporter solute-binding subunit [Microbacterium sp. SD291]